MGTWLIEPVKAVDFSLPDLTGNAARSSLLQGKSPLAEFLDNGFARLPRPVAALSADPSPPSPPEGFRSSPSTSMTRPTLEPFKSFASKEGLTFPILMGTQELAGIYNIVYRYLFDRHRDLSLPTSFLIDEARRNSKGVPRNLHCLSICCKTWLPSPNTAADRIRKRFPSRGLCHQDAFQRNAFTYGVAFFQHGFLDQAEQSFKQVIAREAR